jgi:hypothetical protein
LLGQLPHRDFDDVYTGGLSLLNALAFRVLGENLVSPRLVVFFAALAMIPPAYFIASRFLRPFAAFGTTVAAFLCGIPTYPAAMPSWYNLVLAVMATAALLRFTETQRAGWLFLAGVCAGISITIKIVGVYLLAGISLSLVFIAASESPSDLPTGRPPAWRIVEYLPFGFVAILALLPLIILGERPQFPQILRLGLPVVALCAAACVSLQQAQGAGQRLLSRLVRLGWPVAVGAALPLVLFLVPYMTAGALRQLYDGVLVLPRRRIVWTSKDGPSLIDFVLAIPAIYLAVSWRFSARRLTRGEVAGIVILEIGVVVAAALSLTVTAVFWAAVRTTAPVMIVATAVLVSRREDDGARKLPRQRLFVTGCSAAWCALVQFPVESYQYFLYVLPLFVLATAALVATRGVLSRTVSRASLAAFILVAALLRTGYIGRSGGNRVVLGRQAATRLDIARGGLLIRSVERDEYARLVSLVQSRSRSRFIYVTPDAPEVYFLSERDNPTRTLFDFFDDPSGRTGRIISSITARNVDLVVLNRVPTFSGAIPRDLEAWLTTSFDSAATAGQFEVRWHRINSAARPRS